MVCKPIHLINPKLKEIYDYTIFCFDANIQATVSDARFFLQKFSQLTQLTSGNIPDPDRFDQMICIEHGVESESLQQIISIL